MRDLELPIWLNRGKVKQLAEFLQQWWLKVEGWLQLPLQQLDPETSTLGILHLLAWGRNVTQIPGEPESLYRLRVKHAFINAVDAGSVAGIQRIFERLGVGYVEVLERQAGKDWDVITLQLSDAQLSQNQALLSRLLEKYGRTCRRYEFGIITPIEVGISGHEFDHAWYYDEAE